MFSLSHEFGVYKLDLINEHLVEVLQYGEDFLFSSLTWTGGEKLCAVELVFFPGILANCKMKSIRVPMSRQLYSHMYMYALRLNRNIHYLDKCFPNVM